MKAFPDNKRQQLKRFRPQNLTQQTFVLSISISGTSTCNHHPHHHSHQ